MATPVEKLDSPLRYRHEAVVIVPAGIPFPLDMLRYDACFPKTGEDVGRMGRTLQGTYYQKEVWISVVAYSEKNHGHWRPERWKSFGVTLEIEHG